MTAIKWASGVSGNWTTASDWTGGVVPGAGDDVTIDAEGAYGVTISSAAAADSLTLNDASATLLVNQHGTFSVGSSVALSAGTLELDGGRINGGTIASTGGTFDWVGGELSGVTFDGTLNLDLGPNRFFASDVVMHGADGTGEGVINLIAGKNGAPALSLLYTSMMDDAVVNMGNGAQLLWDGGTNSTLTLGVDLTIDQTGKTVTLQSESGLLVSIANEGVINATYNDGAMVVGYETGGHYNVGAFTNAGTLNVGNADTITVGAGTFLNQGTIALTGAGQLIAHGATMINQGVVTLTGGAEFLCNDTTVINRGVINVGAGQTLALDGPAADNAAGASITASTGSTLLLGARTFGPLSNEGTITATGAIVDLYGDPINTGVINITNSTVYLLSFGIFTTAGLAAFENQGNALVVGGGPQGEGGTLDNSDAVLSVGAGTAVGVLTLGARGVISGGTVIDAGSGVVFNSGTLDGVTYVGEIDISSGGLDVEGGITLEPPGGGAGTIVASGAGTGVQFGGNQTVQDLTVDASGAYGGVNFEGANLENITIVASGQGNQVQFQGAAVLDDVVVNDSGKDSRINVQGQLTNNDVTFDITGPGAILTIQQASGADMIDNATINLGDDTILTSGSDLGRQVAFTLGAGTTVNQTGDQAEIEGETKYTIAVNLGAINADVAGGQFLINVATFDNEGVIQVGDGDSLDLQAHFTNLSANVLTGGLYEVGASSSLILDATAGGQPVKTNAATIVLSGTGSLFESNPKTGGPIQLETTLTTIAAGGVLELLAGRGWSSNLAMSNAGTLQLGGGTFAASSLANAGTLSGFGVLSTSVSNTGLIEVGAGQTLSFVGGALTNLSGTTLTSGTFVVGLGSTLQLANDTSVVALDAVLVLEGNGSTLQGYDTATGSEVGIKASLTTIDAAGDLQLLDARSFAAAHAISNLGTLQLTGGTYSGGALTQAAGSTLTGFGVVTASVTDGGLIEATGGTLDLTRALTGAGALDIDAGATLEADAGAAKTLTATFAGTGATLALGAAAKFAALIAGFASGETIDLIDTAATGATLGAGGKLVITNGSQTVATLHLKNARHETFTVTSDGHGGSDVTVDAGAAAASLVTATTPASARLASPVRG
jgi:hypothetical protein